MQRNEKRSDTDNGTNNINLIPFDMLKLVEVKISNCSMEEPKVIMMCFDSGDNNCSNYLSEMVKMNTQLDEQYGEFISSIKLIMPFNISTTPKLYDKVNKVIETRK